MTGKLKWDSAPNDPETAAGQIRFALDQLRVRNGHHEFEHICRRIARARICSNILPATGPVAAGGDQGRDFETFRSYLEPIEGPTRGFLGLVSSEPVVFACTLQQNGIRTKIIADVEAILANGETPRSIHYFTVADLPVAKRHELQAEVGRRIGVDLDIWDGMAIAEHLSDPDMFWVAIRYLRIPSDLSPRKTDSDEAWYDELLREWSEAGRIPITYSEFSDLRLAARQATWDPDKRPHLDLWIERLTALANRSEIPDLRRRASYEIAVARLRGLGTWIGYEDSVLALIEETIAAHDPSTLTDAAVLLTYAEGAARLGHAHFDSPKIGEYRHVLIDRATELIDSAPSPNVRCRLLELRGYTRMYLTFVNAVDLDTVFDDWEAALELAADARMFSVLEFAEHLDQYLPLIGDHPRYATLTRLADERVRERHGEFKVAERCRDRALAFHRAGQVVRAMDELHEAKVRWFAEEALHGSLLAMLLLAQWYRDLGLPLAAKYYALAVALQSVYAHDPEHRRFLPKGLLSAAESDYQQGAHVGFMILSDLALRADFHFGDGYDDADPSAPINRSLFHATMTHTLAEAIAPACAEAIHDVITQWGFEEVATELYPTAREVWGGRDKDEVLTAFSEEGMGAPLDDLARTRQIRFAALGLVWQISWRNSRQVTAVAECFIGVLQTLLCDLRSVDLVLLPTTVELHIDAMRGSELSYRQVPAKVGTAWEVQLPADLDRLGNDDEPKGLGGQITPLVLSFLSEVSLLPDSEVMRVLEPRFERGLFGKMFVGDRYDRLYLEFVSQEAWDRWEEHRTFVNNPFGQTDPLPHPELRWRSGPTPGFDPDTYREMVETRYERLKPSVRHTLERLRGVPAFNETVAQLRSEGWLDWQILHALAVAVANERLPAPVREGQDFEAQKAAMLKLMDTPESAEADLPPQHVWSRDHLTAIQQMNQMAILDSLGLVVKQRSPDTDAIHRFLVERTGYHSIDVPHDSLFGPRHPDDEGDGPAESESA